MTDKIGKMQEQYEEAVAAHRDDPSDDRAHARTIALAQKLADARKADREDQIERGVRSPGVSAVAEQTED